MTVSLSVDGRVTEVPDGTTIEVFGARRVSVLFVMELGQESGPVADVLQMPVAQPRPVQDRQVQPQLDLGRKRALLPLPADPSDPPPPFEVSFKKSREPYCQLLSVVWYHMHNREWATFRDLVVASQHYLDWPEHLISQRQGWLLTRLVRDGYLEAENVKSKTDGTGLRKKYRRVK